MTLVVRTHPQCRSSRRSYAETVRLAPSSWRRWRSPAAAATRHRRRRGKRRSRRRRRRRRTRRVRCPTPPRRSQPTSPTRSATLRAAIKTWRRTATRRRRRATRSRGPGGARRAHPSPPRSAAPPHSASAATAGRPRQGRGARRDRARRAVDVLKSPRPGQAPRMSASARPGRRPSCAATTARAAALRRRATLLAAVNLSSRLRHSCATRPRAGARADAVHRRLLACVRDGRRREDPTTRSWARPATCGVGRPGLHARALYPYNPSSLYVSAVGATRADGRDPRAFYAFYASGAAE